MKTLKNGFCLLFLLSALCPMRGADLVVSVPIDGQSRLVLQRTQVFWNHLSLARPVNPTVLNGYAWHPNWPSDSASNSSPLAVTVSFANDGITLNKEAGRGPASIVQQPTAGNGFTLIVDFNDTALAGADQYTVTLHGVTFSIGGSAEARTVLVPTGTIWRYLDNGTDPGFGWQFLDFDDSSWASGRAQLGYGDGDEATIVSFGTNPGFKFVTTYFRRAFAVNNPEDITSLTVRLLRDDGGVVYLNGVEVFRSNMPFGFIDYLTLAASTIPNSDESIFFSAPVDRSLLLSGSNVIAVEIHQANRSSSDISFDLELAGGVPTGPPVILRQPRPQLVAPGGTATFSIQAVGGSPLSYQWAFDGVEFQGATNATLTGADLMAEDQGTLTVTVRNPFGSVVSAGAQLTVVELTGDLFQLTGLTTNHAFATGHFAGTGDDRGGIAASFNDLFVTGDAATARFNLPDLSDAASVGRIHDSLASDLKSGRVFVLANGMTPSTFGSINSLLEVDGATGVLTTNAITLSTNIDLNGCYGCMGVYSGFGRIVLHNGSRAFSILLPSGTVRDLGPMTPPQHAYSENWAYWGVAEFFDNTTWLVCVRDAQTISRTRVPDGLTLPVAVFDNLSDTASITVSPVLNRWYFHHQYTSQFRSGTETVGFADARIAHEQQAQPPAILLPPHDRSVREGSNATFTVVALGHPLNYQWQFNGHDIDGATNQTLALVGVGAAQVGLYAVVVANNQGSATSAPALLNVVAGGNVVSEVAVFSADVPNYIEDVRQKLERTGLFTRVDGFQVQGGFPVPSLAQLQQYGAVLVHSDYGFNDPVAMGNVLADYVDAGGGLVLATFVFQSPPTGLDGRIMNAGYLPFTIGGNNSPGGLSLVADNPSHAILEGVVSFSGGGSSYHNSPLNLTDGAELVAHWSNGQPLVGIKPAGGVSVVALNFFPPSSEVSSGFWDARTDGARLMANALTFAGDGGGSTVPFVPAAIRTQPANATVLQGLDAKFSVTAYGSAALAYQWRFNNAPIADATNRTLLLTDVQTNQAGAYRVVVTNAFGSITSQVATLTVQPTRGVAGHFTDFDTSSTGLVESITSAQFTPRRIDDIRTFDFSRLNVLLIDEPSDRPSPELRHRLPALQDWVNRGGRLILHERYFNQEALASNPFLLGTRGTLFTNFSSFTTDINVLPPRNTLVTTGPHGTLNDVSLDGGDLPLQSHAIGSTLPAGGAAILGSGPDTNQVVAFAYGLGAGLVYFSTIPLDYYLDFTNSMLAPVMRDVYAPNVIEYAAAYTPAGPPVIFNGPNNVVATAGNSATFLVSARGQAPLRYQWLFNNAALPGATNNPLQLTHVSNSNAGVYSVMVNNELGGADSPNATLKVVPQATVGVFDDPRFVYTQPGSPDDKSENIQATLVQLGHAARPFTILLAAVTNDVLLFPELGITPLAPQLDNASRALLQAYVLQGSLLIVAGGYYYNLDFLNSVFGFSLISPGTPGGVEYVRTSQAAGTPFTDAPSAIFGNGATYPLYTSTLPPGALNLYQNTDYGATAVALIPYGAGAVLFLGWNWYDAAPLGGQDGGWVETLASALQARGISPPAARISVPLIPVGSVWRYLDNGSNQGTGWHDLGFNDASWAAGPAQLGYGDGNEATVVSFGPDPDHKFVTTYFRRAFTVADAAAVTNLTLRLLRDDGAAVYLNGVEILRDCLPFGATFDTLAYCNISGSEEGQFLTYAVNSALLRNGTNLLAVEIHQVTPFSSDISFDLELLGIAPAPAPVIRTQPVGQTVPAGSTVVLNVVAVGALPLSYQWRLNGQNLTGATNAILLLTGIATNQSGSYSVVASNALGSATSSNALVRAVVLGGDTFRIASLSTNNALVIDPYPFTGNERGGIAASGQELFYSGSFGTARFGLADLAGGTNFGQTYEALASDLSTEKAYLLASGTNPITPEGGIVTALLELDGPTGALNGNSIRLSQPVELLNPPNRGGEVGIFAGSGRIVVHDGRRAWSIELPSGLVVELGPVAVSAHLYSQTWAYWGVAEFFDDAIWLVYVRDSQAIVRTRVPDGATETVGEFSNLSTMASITVSLPFNRWYFHHPYESQFGGFYQNLGFADATFVSSATPTAPEIVRQPVDQTIAASGTVVLRVVARGTGPLGYQWMFEDAALPGATNASLTLSQLTTNQAGRYSVVVGNVVHSVRSSNALVTVVPLSGSTLRITNLSTNNAVVVDHGFLTGGARAGLAASARQLFYSGNYGVARFDLADLSGGTSLSPPGGTNSTAQLNDGLVSDLGTETVYALADGTNLVNGSGGVVTTLLEVDGLTGGLTGASLPLSQRIDLGNRYGEVGLFAGLGRIVVTDGAQAWSIETSSGRVLSLGPMTVPNHLYAGVGAYWGVAEFFAGSIWLVYVQDNTTIVRSRAPDGLTETVANFAYLADMPAITVSLAFNRWYFHHEGSSQFSPFYQTIGFADASYVSSAPPIAPSIVKPPASQTIATGGTVVFNVTTRGTGPLAYQWLFESNAIPGAINATLTLSNVAFNQAGRYAVVASNAAGTATSAAAVLRVIPSVTVSVFDDPAFVYTYDDPFAQSDSVQASLRLLGHQVTTFTNLELAANGGSPLLLPALEAGELALTLNPDTTDALQKFVARGGVMILHGCNNDFNRPARLLNTVLGFAVTPSYSPLPVTRTAQAGGTAFADDPDSLPTHRFTSGLLASSLPPGARLVYGNGDDAAVVLFPFGSGKIIFLGWNWSDAVPLGPLDGGWLAVLGSAIEETAPPSPRAPEILEQPQNRPAVVGTQAKFRVLATGYPLNYQWLFNSQPLSGATNFVLQLSNVTANHAGAYSVIVSNALGSVTSTVAVLTVAPALFVGVFDDPQFVDTSGAPYAESDNVQASLAQLGHNVRPFTSIAAAVTNDVLLFPYFKLGDPTSSLDVTSRAALQSFVQQGGLVIMHGGYGNVSFLNNLFGFSLGYYGYAGGPYIRSSHADGTRFTGGPPFLPYNDRTLTLYSSTLPLFGARNLYTNDFLCAVAQIPYGAGNIVYLGWDWYYSAPGGSQDSGWVETLGNAVLTRIALPPAPPVMTLQPLDQSVLAGQDVTFAAGAIGSMPLLAQWFHNGLLLPGATNPILELSFVASDAAGSYHVTVSNPGGSSTSRVATLVVRPSRGLAGYHQSCCGYSTAPLAEAIQLADYTPLEIPDITTFDITRLNLLLLTVDAGNRPQALLDRMPAIEAWVNNGGRLIVHDWFVSTDSGPNPFLPAAAGTVLIRAPAENVQILPPGDNLLVAGPHGTLDDSSLDGASSSFHGYARRDTLPPRALPILGAGLDTNAVVAFSYALGAGSVYYAGMPLDHHLNQFNTVGDTFRTVYVPNLLGFAAAFTVGGPPVLLAEPRNSGALVGGTAAFAVSANGQGPLYYQWIFNGVPLPGATNSHLVLPGVTTNQAGGYSVIVSNPLGTLTSAVAVLTVIQATPFRITALTTNASQIVDHFAVTSDDRGGIAGSATHLYYTGDAATGRFSATNLAGGTGLSQRYDALVSNLRTETIYTLADGVNLVTGSGGNVTALIEINGSTGDLTTNRVELSAPIPLGFDTGIFASYGAAVLHTGGRVYRIDLPSGLVMDLGALSPFQHSNCESWAYWGVAEFFAGAVHLDYVLDSQTIARTRVPDGFTTNLASFSYLGDMCCFTVSTPRSRWYFHHQGSSQFGGGSETLGFASAAFDRPPRMSSTLVDLAIPEDSTTGPLSFGVLDSETPTPQLITTASSSNPALLPEANIVFAGTNITRTVTLTPAPDQSGTSVVTVTLFDGIGLSTNRSFTLVVLPVNDPPSFTKGADLSVLEDSGSQSFSNWATALSAGPLNEAGQTYGFQATNDNPSLFAVSPVVAPNGTLTFTPAADANGSALVTLRLQDSGGTLNGGQDTSPPQTFSITVQPVNDRPLANAQSVTGPEDSPLAITLSGSDLEGSPLTFGIVASPAHGTLAGSGAARTYRPATNFFGDDSFTFKANDGLLDSAEATVTIHVTPVNDAPIANSQSLTNSEDTALAITLTGSDVDGDALSFIMITPPAHGTLTGSGASRNYRPATNYFGADSFSFKVNDSQLDSAAATVSIQILPVNDAPVANPQSLTNQEDAALAITLTGSDVDGDAFAFTIVVPPAHGTLAGSGASRTYHPATNFAGVDNFAFKVNDSQADSPAAVINIVILPVNDPPAFARGPDQTAPENSGPQTAAQWATQISPGPPDETAQTLAFQVTNDQPSLFAMPPAIAPDGTLTFTPAPNANGIATVTVRLQDNGGIANGGQDTSAAQTFRVTVFHANQPPVAVSRVSPLVFLTPDAPNGFVLSRNNSNAVAILDGSFSHDPENDPLSYAWFEGAASAAFASGVGVSNEFNLGNHVIRLVVNDGQDTGSSTSIVQVISAADAVASVILFINHSTLAQNRQRPLTSTLDAAAASFERGSLTSGITQLRAFQNKVRAQVAPLDPGLADVLTQAVQKIIDAERVLPRLLASMVPPKGRLQLTLIGEAGSSYSIQSSTNLIHWTAVTNIVSVTGTNQFTDASGPTVSRRFYRALGQ